VEEFQLLSALKGMEEVILGSGGVIPGKRIPPSLAVGEGVELPIEINILPSVFPSIWSFD
jgi:hypothetical protein